MVIKEIEVLVEKINKGCGEPLVLVLEELDRILENEESHLPRRLVHYLKNRSYQKAYLWFKATEG